LKTRPVLEKEEDVREDKPVAGPDAFTFDADAEADCEVEEKKKERRKRKGKSEEVDEEEEEEAAKGDASQPSSFGFDTA
jgi:hypothetical protein